MDDPPTPRADKFCRMRQENMARRPLPLRVRGREMPPDIAIGQRAINGVGKRVQPDIGVGMPLQPLIVRNAYSAEPEVVAFRKAVDVETLTGAGLESGQEHALGPGKIIRCRD